MNGSSERTPGAVKLSYLAVLTGALALGVAPAQTLISQYADPEPETPIEQAVVDETAPVEESKPAPDGAAIFAQTCAPCHQATGQGIPGVFPPLAGSDFLLADADRAIGVVLRGLSGSVTVNGVAYNSMMPPMPLNDDDAAAVLSYVMTAWGNTGSAIDPADVARVRRAGSPTQ